MYDMGYGFPGSCIYTNKYKNIYFICVLCIFSMCNEVNDQHRIPHNKYQIYIVRVCAYI